MNITITNWQLSNLSSTRFENRLVDILSRGAPAAATYFATQQGIQALQEQCAKARSYGLKSELEIGRYVISAWLLGSDFDERFPSINEYLRTTRLTPSQKAEAIERIATAVLSELLQGTP